MSDNDYEVLKPFRHVRRMRSAGERLTLDAAQAQFLLRGGFVRPAAAATDTRKAPEKAPRKTTGSEA